jgi:hypothetical protein
LKFKVQQLRARGAGREADPQLGEIARAAGLDILRVRSGMNWLLAVAVEAVSCFGLFAIAWHRVGRGTKPAKADLHGTRPWRLVEGEEAVSGRSLLRLTGPGEGHSPARKPKTKASGKAGRRARSPPNGNSRDAETDQSLKRKEGASDVR